MPSLVAKMQPWTQTHCFIPQSLRRSRSSSSAASSTPLTSSTSTTSLLSSGGSSNSGGSDIMAKTNSSSSKNSSTRAGGGTGSSGGLFGKFCSATSSGSKNSSKVNSVNSGSSSSNNNANVCNGTRPKRKTPILSTCMSNWVKFDHDCQKPLHCSQCESNQEHNRKVLFSSGGNVLISTGHNLKGKNLHHRHSHNFFGGGESGKSHLPHHVNGIQSLSEPSSPTDCIRNSSIGDSHNNTAFPGEVVSWENAKNSSFKIVINVPCLDMNLFQNENVQVEIVCNKKLATGKDFETVQRSRTELKSSGWYWEGIDSEASMELLENTKPGSFIVRDSSDPRFLYSLSIQTERGPTSVRLPYRNGKFSLDGDDKLVDTVPNFDSVIGLIEHYVNGGTKIGKQVSVWIDHEGNMHSFVKLTKPVRRDVGSLKHLARVAINRNSLLTNNNNNSDITTSSPITSTSNSSNSIPAVSSASTNKKVTSTSSAISPMSSPASVENASNSSQNIITPVPKLENTITSSSSATTSCAADLSKLPSPLQNYMSEYPYVL